MSVAISAHGTLVARQPGGAGGFTDIAELRDINPPALTRNNIETTNQNDSDDAHVVGVRRRGTLGFQIGFLPSNSTHDSSTGLLSSFQNGSLDGWKITYPGGKAWLFSGYLVNFQVSAPTDDGLIADVEVQPTGTMQFI